jgi:hypothetical protein
VSDDEHGRIGRCSGFLAHKFIWCFLLTGAHPRISFSDSDTYNGFGAASIVKFLMIV